MGVGGQKASGRKGDSSLPRRTGHSRHGRDKHKGMEVGCAWACQQTQLPNLTGMRPTGEVGWPDRKGAFVLRTPFVHKILMHELDLFIFYLFLTCAFVVREGHRSSFGILRSLLSNIFRRVGLKGFEGCC